MNVSRLGVGSVLSALIFLIHVGQMEGQAARDFRKLETFAADGERGETLNAYLDGLSCADLLGFAKQAANDKEKFTAIAPHIASALKKQSGGGLTAVEIAAGISDGSAPALYRTFLIDRAASPTCALSESDRPEILRALSRVAGDKGEPDVSVRLTAIVGLATLSGVTAADRSARDAQLTAMFGDKKP